MTSLEQTAMYVGMGVMIVGAVCAFAASMAAGLWAALWLTAQSWDKVADTKRGIMTLVVGSIMVQRKDLRRLGMSYFAAKSHVLRALRRCKNKTKGA